MWQKTTWAKNVIDDFFFKYLSFPKYTDKNTQSNSH